jgi:hypothetical protein
MRAMVIGTMVLFLLGVRPAPAAAAGTRAARRVACCLRVFVPAPAPAPRCFVAHLTVRGRLRARRACRLLGGCPVRLGRCACRSNGRCG